MNINTKLIAGTLAGTMLLTGCAVGVNNRPVGHSSTVTTNNDTCMVNTQNSINLILFGGSTSSNSFNNQCARQQVVRLLLAADLSHDPRADADTKALALAIAGMEDTDVRTAIENVSTGLTPTLRAQVERNITSYRDSLKAQGAAAERAIWAPQLNTLQGQLAQANNIYITVEKPEYCADANYTHITNDLNAAFPMATVTLRDTTLENMGVVLDENLPNFDKTKDDLCHGSFMYVSARQGYDANMIEVRHERFYQDQSTHIEGSGSDRPQLDSTIIIGYVAQKFNVSEEFQAVIHQRQVEQTERLAAIEAKARLEDSQREADLQQAQQARREAALSETAPMTVSPQIPTPVPASYTRPESAMVEQARPVNEFTCETVLTDQNIIRSYEHEGATHSFQIDAGNIDRFVCSNGDSVKEIFVAASYSASIDRNADIAVFTPEQKIQDRQSGVFGWMKSLLPSFS